MKLIVKWKIKPNIIAQSDMDNFFIKIPVDRLRLIAGLGAVESQIAISVICDYVATNCTEGCTTISTGVSLRVGRQYVHKLALDQYLSIEQNINKLGYIEISLSKQVNNKVNSKKESIGHAPPLRGSRSEKRSSVKKITTKAEDKVSGANDSPSQGKVKARTDLQIIVDDYYKPGVEKRLGISLGNVYECGKTKGLIKKMLTQHGLEETKKIFMGACMGYSSGDVPFMREANLRIGAIHSNRQECLTYYELLQKIKKETRRVEAGEDGIQDGNVSATKAGT